MSVGRCTLWPERAARRVRAPRCSRRPANQEHAVTRLIGTLLLEQNHGLGGAAGPLHDTGTYPPLGDDLTIACRPWQPDRAASTAQGRCTPRFGARSSSA